MTKFLIIVDDKVWQDFRSKISHNETIHKKVVDLIKEFTYGEKE